MTAVTFYYAGCNSCKKQKEKEQDEREENESVDNEDESGLLGLISNEANNKSGISQSIHAESLIVFYILLTSLTLEQLNDAKPLLRSIDYMFSGV